MVWRAARTPYMILYHFNMGYPLLAPGAELSFPAGTTVKPRNARAAEDLDTAAKVIEAQAAFEEQCYYYEMSEGRVKLHNRDLGIAMTMTFDTAELPFFTQWKLMQAGEYVMGLEPGEKAEQTIKISITEEK